MVHHGSKSFYNMVQRRAQVIPNDLVRMVISLKNVEKSIKLDLVYKHLGVLKCASANGKSKYLRSGDVTLKCPLVLMRSHMVPSGQALSKT